MILVEAIGNPLSLSVTVEPSGLLLLRAVNEEKVLLKLCDLTRKRCEDAPELASSRRAATSR